jgi:hypothetical protein
MQHFTVICLYPATVYIDFILQKTNKKKKERDFKFYSLYHQGQIFLCSRLKEELSDDFSE